MDTKKIREALEFGLALAVAKQTDTGRDHSILIKIFKDALAELDAAPKVLTDEPVAWMVVSSIRDTDIPTLAITKEAARQVAIERCYYLSGAQHSEPIPLYLAPAAPPKGLTDEEIEHHAFNHPIWHRGKEPSRDGERDGWAPDSLEEAFIVGAIWYRDNNSAAGLTVLCGCGDEIKPNTDAICGNCAAKPTAAGLTVEEAEECLVEHLAQYGPDWGPLGRNRLRTRLTAAIEAKR